MDYLEQRVEQIIKERLDAVFDHRWNAFVDQFTERMGALIANRNRSPNLIHRHNPIFNDDSFFDVEEEEYKENVHVDVDEVEDIFVTIDKPIFDSYPPDDGFMLRDEEKIIVDEPIFDVFPLEDEFVSRDENTVIADEPIFDTYPPEEEFEFENEGAVIIDNLMFHAYPLEGNEVTGVVEEVDYEKKTVFNKIYEQLIENAEVQEKAKHVNSNSTEDDIILIACTDFSMQVKEKVNEKSTPTDGKFSIHNKVSIEEIWVWWKSIFLGFIRLIFDPGRINKNSRANFVHPGENDAVENK